MDTPLGSFGNPVSIACRADSRLIVVRPDGIAACYDSSNGVLLSDIGGGVLAAGAANGSNRCAILRALPGGASRAARLSILNESLDEVNAIDVPMSFAARPYASVPWTHCISWSATDEVIAISTSPQHRSEGPAECFLFDHAKHSLGFAPNWSNVWFVDDRRVVASRFGCPYAVRLAEVLHEGEQMTLAALVSGRISGWRVAASDPVRGLFAVWQTRPFFLPLAYRGKGILEIRDSRGNHFGSSVREYSLFSTAGFVDRNDRRVGRRGRRGRSCNRAWSPADGRSFVNWSFGIRRFYVLGHAIARG